MTKQKWLQFGWEVLIHPPYSPNIAASDAHLFWTLQHSLNGKKKNAFPQSVKFSRSVVSDSLRPHGLQHARPPCPSPTPGVYPNLCPLCW